MERITVETLRTCKLGPGGHFRGSGFFGNFWRCIEYPRLQKVVTNYRKTRTAEVHFTVDGKKVADLAAAAEALNYPPQPTPEMIETLAGITREWADRRKLIPIQKLLLLGELGLIEWQDGKCRLSEHGVLALHHAGLLL